ncbi:MAG: histidine phosphatase family protein [Lachnospiraceae bacterium]|nr:histidine phosphatase family protein [Lachnospiraceae bacterium]
MTVYVVRHGETRYNKAHLLQGEVDIELNEYGRELARLTAEGLKDIHFDRVFSSPLCRARETARIIMGDRDIPFTEDARIQEISLGEYEGLCFGQENYNIPDPDFMYFFSAPERYKTAPKGESFEEVIARTGAFWEELTHDPENAGKTILVTAHGASIRGLLSYIRKTPISGYWGTGLFKNCAVAILKVSPDGVETVEEGKVYY